jgi:hypothetical protein
MPDGSHVMPAVLVIAEAAYRNVPAAALPCWVHSYLLVKGKFVPSSLKGYHCHYGMEMSWDPDELPLTVLVRCISIERSRIHHGARVRLLRRRMGVWPRFPAEGGII